MSDSSTLVGRKLDQVLRRHRRQVALFVVVRAVWLGLAALAALLLLDAGFAFGDWARVGIDAGVAAGLAAVAAWSWRSSLAATSERRMMARKIESIHPEAGNLLINAVDFDERMRGTTSTGASEELMRDCVARAGDTLDALAEPRALRPPSLRGESLLAGGVLALLLLGAALFPNIAVVLVPRFLLPLGDYPPFSLTRLTVEPDVIAVDYGDNIVVRLAASGRLPDRATLVLEGARREPLAELPMFQAEEGHFFQTIENARRDLLYHVRVPNGRSRRHLLTINKRPLLQSVSLQYHYPPYTFLKPETRTAADGRIAAYAGTRISVTARSNRPLAGGTLTACGTNADMAVAGQFAVAGEFVVRTQGDVKVELRDVEGYRSLVATIGAVHIIPDTPPQIAIVSPGMDSFAVPDAQVSINMEARDDLGVDRLALVRNLNGSSDALRTVHTGRGDEKFVNVIESMDLADLGVRPGDVIEYYAVAFDHRPDDPQSAYTPSYRLRIISFDEYREFVQRQDTAERLREKYEAMERRMQDLADRQEALLKELRELQSRQTAQGDLSPEEKQRLRELADRQAALAKEADTLAAELMKEATRSSIYDVEEDFKRDLAKFATDLEKARGQMDQSAGAMRQAADAAADGRPAPMTSAEDLQRQALETLRRDREEFQQGIAQANQDIARIMKLLEDIERFKYLIERQKGVRTQARLYKDKPQLSLDDRIRLRELSQEQEQTRTALEQLKEDFRAHAEEIAADYPTVARDARELVGAIEHRDILARMARARDTMAAGSGAAGFAAAEEAYQQMLALTSQCDGAGGAASSQCELRLRIQMNMKLGNTLQQMLKGVRSGMGRGLFGAMGDGTGGMAGGQTPFAVFGTEQLGVPSARSSAGGGRKDAKAQEPQRNRDSMAGNIEELTSEKVRDDEGASSGSERMMEEYRALIEAYFRNVDKKE